LRYDDEVERQRRLVCDSALGQLVLDNPELVGKAVSSVNTGIRMEWLKAQSDLKTVVKFQEEKKSTDSNGKVVVTKVDKELPLGEHIVERDGKYVSNKTSFGRHVPVKLDPNVTDKVVATVNRWLTAFDNTDLPRQMTLHDVFLKVYCTYTASRSNRRTDES